MFNFALRRKFKPLFSTTMSLYLRQNRLLCESACAFQYIGTFPALSRFYGALKHLSPVPFPRLAWSSLLIRRHRHPGALTVSRPSLSRSSLSVAPATHSIAFPSTNSTLFFVQSVPFSWEQATSSFDTLPNEVPVHSWLWRKNFP